MGSLTFCVLIPCTVTKTKNEQDRPAPTLCVSRFKLRRYVSNTTQNEWSNR